MISGIERWLNKIGGTLGRGIITCVTIVRINNVKCNPTRPASQQMIYTQVRLELWRLTGKIIRVYPYMCTLSCVLLAH